MIYVDFKYNPNNTNYLQFILSETATALKAINECKSIQITTSMRYLGFCEPLGGI